MENIEYLKLAHTKKRFNAQVVITETCHEWKGTMDKKQPRFGYLKKKITAHRASFILNGGQLESGERVRRSCGNIKCVNPKHLYVT